MAEKQIIFEFMQEHDALNHSGESALVLCLSSDQVEDFPRIHPSLDKEIELLISKNVFKGHLNEVHVLPSYGLISYAYVILIGIGKPLDPHMLREMGASVYKATSKHKISSIFLRISQLHSMLADTPLERLIEVLSEGFLLSDYKMKTYQKNNNKGEHCLQKITFIIEPNQERSLDIEQVIKMAKVGAESTHYARDLTNLPGNYLTPSALADEAVKLSNTYGFTCDILDENEILKLGMGGLYEVGKGSVHPPRMIVMRYQGLDEWTDVLGLVGKGITFDTGGISLKKSKGMEEMISDMGGAAVVMGVMRSIGELQPKINAVAVIPAAENMPSGSAYKPGDIVTTLSGRTVEVLNTDAEGRIVLADGITYAKQLGATQIIEISTLTGAVLVTLGDVATAAVTNNESFLEELIEASKYAGEKVWQLPAYPEYWEMIKSSVADIKNSSGPNASTITAALFIGTFAEDTPWIHLDTGGTAWLWNERGIETKGGTGAMVRTILQMMKNKL